MHGEPGQVVTATPSGSAKGWSLAIPACRAGSQDNAQSAVGWALGLCHVCGDMNRGDEPWVQQHLLTPLCLTGITRSS